MRPFLLADLRWKLASLLIAILVWMVIRGEIERRGSSQGSPFQDREAVRAFQSIPVRVLTSASDDRGYTVSPTIVDVEIAASSSLIESLTIHDLNIYVDLTQVAEFTKLEKELSTRLPAGVDVISIRPSTVQVSNGPR